MAFDRSGTRETGDEIGITADLGLFLVLPNIVTGFVIEFVGIVLVAKVLGMPSVEIAFGALDIALVTVAPAVLAMAAFVHAPLNGTVPMDAIASFVVALGDPWIPG